jgi:hypothetical protein
VLPLHHASPLDRAVTRRRANRWSAAEEAPRELNVLSLWPAARGQLPDDAALARQLRRHVRVRRLPDGRWIRWRDLA